MIKITYGYLVRHSGVGRYISEVLSQLPQRGEVELLTIENDIQSLEGIKVTKVDCARNPQFLSVSENLSFSREVERQIENSDLLHSHGVYKLHPNIYTAHICLKRYFEQVKAHGGEEELPKEINELVALEKGIVENCKFLTTVSNKVADEISDSYSVDRDKILVIKGASRLKGHVDGNKFKDDLRIGFVGGNLKAKGIPSLVGAANILEGKGLGLKVIGAGTNKGIEDYFLKHAKFDYELKGKIELGTDFYQSLNVYVCPSLYESYSLSTLEAMAIGLPVISSNLNGVFYDNPEINLARVNDIHDKKEIADMTEQVVKDKEFRSNVVNAGKEISTQTNWEEISNAYSKLYSSI